MLADMLDLFQTQMDSYGNICLSPGPHPLCLSVRSPHFLPSVSIPFPLLISQAFSLPFSPLLSSSLPFSPLHSFSLICSPLLSSSILFAHHFSSLLTWMLNVSSNFPIMDWKEGCPVSCLMNSSCAFFPSLAPSMQ
jgi:hypothetical protein